MNNVHNLRRSQFILTYGPGAIIEGKNGSKIIPKIDLGLDLLTLPLLKKLEIADVRMSSILTEEEAEKSKLFIFPSNSYFEVPPSIGVYSTYPFPLWRMCFETHAHPDPILFRGSRCPICKKKSLTNVRFVAACTEGHLDDVDWNTAVHGEIVDGKMVNKSECSSNFFYWKIKGSSLSSIQIKCPKCNKYTTMGQIYSADFDCTGWLPEKKDDDTYFKRSREYNCKGVMKVLQKQSTALRIPETFTLLKIPKYDNKIPDIIQSNENIFMGCLKNSTNESKFLTCLSLNVDRIRNEISEKGYEGFVRYMKDILNRDVTINDILDEEFEALKGKNECSINFKKRNPVKKIFPFYDNDLSFKVYPIDLLKTVTVQKGYRRLPYMKKEGQSELIKSSIEDFNGIDWYPSFESIGEGIFITAESNPLNSVDPSIVKKWEKRKNFDDGEGWHGGPIGWRDGNVKCPQFIWWHTLSHSLIRTLSIICGYSSASLRERVYMDSNAENGGILIYAASIGEDGGMGGLVESIDSFDEILESAWESLLFCSNDPLCSEMKITENRVNGSACHSCLMTSETSCEHGNRWLDRNILLGGD